MSTFLDPKEQKVPSMPTLPGRDEIEHFRKSQSEGQALAQKVFYENECERFSNALFRQTVSAVIHSMYLKPTHQDPSYKRFDLGKTSLRKQDILEKCPQIHDFMATMKSRDIQVELPKKEVDYGSQGRWSIFFDLQKKILKINTYLDY